MTYTKNGIHPVLDSIEISPEVQPAVQFSSKWTCLLMQGEPVGANFISPSWDSIRPIFEEGER